MKTRAFTLVEMLIAIAIAAILAALLFPVFRSAKIRAQRAVWVDNCHQNALATILYMGDYDDHFMVARYSPEEDGGPENDRTWIQNLLPYSRDFSMFLCPVDDTRDPSVKVLDSDVLPGETYSRYYEASKRANLGYNFLYLAPMIKTTGWESRSRMMSEIGEPSSTIMFGDSAWEVVNGKARGGGSYLIVPPCRFTPGKEDSFGLNGATSEDIFLPPIGWVNQSEATTDYKAGGLYPWFAPKVNIVFTDGSAKALTMAQITSGCNVEPKWSGSIVDSHLYLWDLR